MQYKNRTSCLILDIDGTLLEHSGTLSEALKNQPKEICGSVATINKWEEQGYHIVLLTGRKESMRQRTVEQLEQVGIIYDQLVMGVGGGTRTLINDMKPDGTKTAFAVNINRNQGIEHIDLDKLC